MQRGFAPQEFEERLSRAQIMMAREGLDALLLTTEPDVRYFSGFLTRFWESPSRPWFLVVPAAGKPIAVIPSIGAALMEKTWIDDIRTWRAPDVDDDGVSLLANTLNDLGAKHVGTPTGHESHLRMPLGDWQKLQAALQGTVRDDARIVARLRAQKSEAEVAKIAHACAIAGRAFARVPEIASAGVPLSAVFRDFQRLCLEEGADWVPYLAGGAEKNGYADVISPASDTPLQLGDILMLDTGLVWDGYFCDFDRNFSMGEASSLVSAAHVKLIDAVEAAAGIARAGTTAAELFHAMDQIVTGGAGGSDAGRLGHGLGMQLTEGLSLIPQDHTVLRAGMVITLEPGIETENGKVLVHEEDILITEGTPRFLSPRSGPDMVQL
ncbi:M24 family metallopeptidase [Sulfitobacter donghicola]|uniref:Peptidase M24 n=1 Tax=Sulfitobacter donghicola DSW-25 = KCTC 12864 = JCM 14565 TaxID=1300350 RepID=A0A073IJS8_9RHOB|nr:Xaa-Pro peptidase family protein [Sulfitobacter donghicola]KEJ89855.1 peptidase M24 [Sulfitobacter donghicola DSW-25 = KCTC 12864 = JCM 14565]KIN67024.1 Metallopeptidase M24-like protein [Sulfitobacter donghicola DSW-25 = KCTC 12864 = JCM 14565]